MSLSSTGHPPPSFPDSYSSRSLALHPPVRKIVPFDPASSPEDRRHENQNSSQRANIVPGIFRQLYMTISHLLGFKERWTLTFFVIFAGGIVGFALARSMFLDPNASLYKKELAGEWFWNSRDPYRNALVVHIWACFFIAWGIVLEFIPAICRRSIFLHRMIGYVLLVLILISVATGWIIARRAQGGEPSVQAVFYILGIFILISVTLGLVHARDVRQHRKWMLRLGSLFGVIVTARLIMVIARPIISDIGTYYSMFSCNEIQASTGSFSKYPACVTAAQTAHTNLGLVYVGIQASTKEAKINFGAATRLATSVGLWIALILHIIGVELYIQFTEKQNRYREGFVLTGDQSAILELPVINRP